MATIVLTWDIAYWYNRDEQPSLDDINFSDGVIKSEPVKEEKVTPDIPKELGFHLMP
ncbi:hypothetical protein [Bacillus pumilus]|uniref:hypothetical protein n=1 Tax=Bacillus pumilus TaxID=1408 RepID=UPI0031F48511